MAPEPLRQSLYEMKVGKLGVALPDVGFGVSQVLPIIVECLRAKPGETIILEQPEIHLHPKVQVTLADFLIARAADGVRVIIETHSDHLIKRLGRRIAEDSVPEIDEMISIYFIDEGLYGANCERIEINDFGEVVNWPVGFFDENEDLFWTRASLRRRTSKS